MLIVLLASLFFLVPKTTVISIREFIFNFVVSPASSKMMISNKIMGQFVDFKDRINIENIKKLKLISALDDGKLVLETKYPILRIYFADNCGWD